MKLIGLSGPVSAGKDTVADYLVDTYGFTKFSFSDALYEEVAAAFRIDKAVLYKRETKETPLEALQYFYCHDERFQIIMHTMLKAADVKYAIDAWCSPRQVLQWWGTEYRRRDDALYWIKKAEALLVAYLERATENPDRQYAGLVNSSTRFPNEAAFIKKWNGEVWHLRRPDWDKGVQDDAKKHVAERGLEPAPEDKVLTNNGTVEQLHTAASLLLQSQPGTSINAGPVAFPDLVSCVACKRVHNPVTRAEVRQILATVGIQRSALLRDLTEESYEGCEECGGREFREVQDGDRHGVPEEPFSPVIVEKLTT